MTEEERMDMMNDEDRMDNERVDKAIDKHAIVWKDRKRTFCGLPWSFTKYSLSRERLFIETGFFTSREEEVRLYRILDLELIRNLRQKIWGLGTIIVHSSDKTMGHFEIKNIKQPKYVKELLADYVEDERDSKRVVNREMMVDHDCDFEEDDNY